jgi:hypothetical protein
VQAGGRAEFANIPAGRYYLAEGYRIDATPNPRIVTVRSGETVEVNLSVQPRPERKVEEAPAVAPPKPPKKEVDDDF